MSDLEALTAAFTGCAASNLPGAGTINGIFNIAVGEKGREMNQYDNPLPAQQRDLLDAVMKTRPYVIIDEISMVDSILLAKIDQRLKEITGINLPFGGKHMILCGDFFQIPPVCGMSLYTAALALNNPGEVSSLGPIGKPKFDGTQLFASYKMFSMMDQYRCVNDKAHTEFLQSLRDFKEDFPITKNYLENLKRFNTLKAPDFMMKPGPKESPDDIWENAPLCVTTNSERTNLNPILAQRFAKRHGVPLIVWRLRCSGVAVDYYHRSPTSLKSFYTLESGLCGMFIKGAPAYIDENVNPSICLANGTPVVMHSITFRDDIEPSRKAILQQRILNAEPGEIVDLEDTIPEFVNVQVKVSQEIADNWKEDETLVSSLVVVPLAFRSRGTSSKNIPGAFGTTVHIASRHRVDLGFVITFHKVQVIIYRSSKFFFFVILLILDFLGENTYKDHFATKSENRKIILCNILLSIISCIIKSYF